MFARSSLGGSYLEYRFDGLDLPVRRVFPPPLVHDPADAPLDALDAAAAAFDPGALALAPDDDLDAAAGAFDPGAAPLPSKDAARDLSITGVLGDDLAAAGGPLHHPAIRSNILVAGGALLGPPDALREGALDSLAAFSTAFGTTFSTALSTICLSPPSTCLARSVCASIRFPVGGALMASRNASRNSILKCFFNKFVKETCSSITTG